MAQRSDTRKILGGSAITIGVVAFIWFWAALITWAARSPYSEDVAIHFATSEYFQEYGFDPTIEYPVEIGRTVDGSAGTVSGEMSIGLFFGTGSGEGSLQGTFGPTSSVLMSLPMQDGSNIIVAIPANRIAFHTEGVESSKIKFDFHDNYEFGRIDPPVAYNSWTDFVFFQAPIVGSGYTVRQSQKWSEFLTQSLDYWLLQSVEKINLYLTPVQYESILFGNP